MVWLLSGIMILQPVAGVQAAEFSDGVAGYFNEEENDTEENQADDFSTNEEDVQFSDEQNGGASSSETPASIPEAEELDDGDEKTQKLEVATSGNNSGKCGENVHWSFKDGILTISGNGDMYSFKYDYSPPWKKFESIIETVVIEQGISNIGNYAFYNYFDNLKTVMLPNSVVNIGKSAFCGCKSLETIALPDSITNIGMDAFLGCRSLETITLPNGVTSIENGTFQGCSNLKTIILPSGITSVGADAFYGCSNLGTIVLPNSITSIGSWAFYGCRSLKTIALPNGITNIESSTFGECSSLQTITLPNSLIYIGMYAFSKCSSLETIVLPDSIKSIEIYAFSKCSSLETITLPHSMTVLCSLFDGCSNLKTIMLPDRVQGIGMNTFRGCSSLETIILPDSVVNIDSEAFKDCFKLKTITLPNSITSINDSAFSGCSSLKDVYYSGREAEWNKLNVTFDHDVTIHYNSSSTSSSDKNFSLKVSKDAVVLGKENSLFMEYEASATGKADSEGKQIKWESSNPSVAKIDQKSTGLIVSQDGNSGSAWINLLTYDVGKTVITGTSVDGRKASVEVEVEPELSLIKNSVSISKEALITLCFVKLEKANREYLEAFMKSLKTTVEGSVTIRDTRYIISEDGKSAEFAGYVNVGIEEGNVLCTSKGGQTVRLQISKKSSAVTVPDYNYEAVLKKWMNDKGTENSINYLTGDKNYLNTLMVAQTENSYLGELVENTSNLVFGGLEGWKNYWNGTTKREEARKILAGLLTNYDDEIKALSMAETAKEFADAYLSALKKANWAYAIDYGLNSEEIAKLYDLCSEDHIENFFLEGQYTDLSKYLALIGGYGEDSKIIKCIRKFTESDEAIESLSKKMKFLGDGLTVLKLFDSTIKKYYEIEALSRADQRYCEMLLYLKQNCSYVPVQQAADDLYNVINNELKSQSEYLTKETIDEIEERTVDIILEAVTAKIPMIAVIYNSYKYSVGFANLIFDTADAQKQSDNMRCVAYIGTYLSEWLKINKATYISSSGNAKNEAAKKTVFAYYMLLETRMKGEESCRKFMELIKFKKGSRQYNVSLEITATLESMEKLLKSNGVLMNQYLNSVMACPVDVMVCDSSGNNVLTVSDGKTSSGTVNGIYYNVYYNALEQDYVKVINLPLKGGYTLKCAGNDLGKVNISVSSISEDGSIIRKEASEIPVKKGSQIQVDNISGSIPVCRLEDKDGKKKEYPVQEEKKEYIAVSSIKADPIKMEITTGEKKIINLSVTPENATNKGIEWVSKNPKIATVNADGVVTGVSVGTTTIRATTVETSGVYVDITIKVTNNGSDITPIPTVTPVTPDPTMAPIKNLETPKMMTVIGNHNVITFKWNLVSDADGYQVYRKVNSGKWKAVKTTKETAYKDKDTKAGYKYSYTVKAYKFIDGKKVYSGYNKKGLSGKLNTTVSLKTNNNTVSVSWKKTNGASGYYIYRATSKNGKYSKIKTITSGKTLKYTDKKVKLGKTYYYKVIPFKKISGKSVKSASSEIKSIVLKKIDSKPISTPDSTWENSAVAQKLISYLKKNGMKWQDSSGGTNYTIDYLKVGKGSVTLQYQNAHGDQKSMLWMSYSLNLEINSKNREVVTLFWGDQYNSKDSKENEVNIDYRVNSNDNSVVGSILTSSFTEKSKVKFYNNYLKDYTLEQMSEKGNSCLQEALPLFESCLKKGDSGVTMADLGFTEYNFSN